MIATSFVALSALALAAPDDPPAVDAPKGVAAILAKHDRTLIRDLAEYVEKNPKAEDVDRAYMALFDKAIEHDWFVDYEPIAKGYLAGHPEGAVRPLAMIVATMARASEGQFDEAMATYRALLKGLAGPEQEEFAVNFAESLAAAATGVGAYDVARQVQQAVAEKYKDNPNLRQKVSDDLARLDRVGKPAPAVAVKDLGGTTLRLEDFRGKYVLVDFWATWCGPCITELPRLQAAYAKYHGRGLEIVGVSLDETRPALVDFVKSRKIPWRQVHNASSEGDMVDAFGVSNIPSSFLIDPKGTIIRLELRGPALDDALAKLIK